MTETSRQRYGRTTGCVTWTLARPLVLILSFAGTLVSAYLAYVDLSHARALCDSPFDCAAVQASRFAYIRGVPVALLGLLAYLAVFVLELLRPRLQTLLARSAELLIFAIAFAGMLYSFYLTYLEFFVIHALCVYCLSSAIIITLLALYTGGLHVQSD